MSLSVQIQEIERGSFEVFIPIEKLIIDKNEIGISLGYSAGKTPQYFMGMIEEVLAKLPSSCLPKGGYKIVDIEMSKLKPDGLFIENNYCKTDKIITSQIKKSEKAAVFVGTIGNAMEQWSKELFNQGNTMLGYIVDTVASAAVESAVDFLHNEIGKAMLDEGLKITNRYSPGYCNWPVSDQHILFSLLPKNFCGISLTDSALMYPIKSISGIIGVGKDVRRMKYICDKCKVKDCAYRPYYLAINKRRHTKLTFNQIIKD